MRFETVLFDLDGTLVDHFAAIHRCHAHTREQMGLSVPSMEQVRRAVGGGFETALARLLGEEHIHRLPEAIPIYSDYWEKTMLDDVALLPGALTLLERLHADDVTSAVITNKHGPSARVLCGHLHLDRLLAGVFGAFDTIWLKPHPSFTRHVMEMLGRDLGTTCLVGDSPYDVEAARNVRIPCFALTTGTHSRDELLEAGATAVYDHIDALAAEQFA